MISTRRRAFPALLLGIALASGPAAAQMPNAPPPAVTVETVKSGSIAVTYEYAGRVVASREVEVRARVGGILLERRFAEGARVKAGDVLFAIDRRPYEAEVALAQAQMQQAQAQLNQARRVEERTQALTQRGAASAATLDDAASGRELAEASVAQANARLITANLSLNYTAVAAPVSGITSLEQVPEGSLLQAGDLLTRVTQLDPVYVNFSAADTEANAIRRQIESGDVTGRRDALKVTVSFGDGSTYDGTGRIDFTSSSIDPETGTILSRAVLPNPENHLLPGQFVRVAIEGLTLDNAVSIPTAALMQGPQGAFVYTLDADNVAAVRPITAGRELKDRLVVTSGLKDGDRVVTVGVVKVRPGSPVAPTAAAGPAPAGGGDGATPQAASAPKTVAEAAE